MQESPSALPEGGEQGPLGKHPSADEVIDVAVQYTFPASDATAIGAGVHAAEKEQRESIDQPAALKRRRQQQEFVWPTGPGR